MEEDTINRRSVLKRIGTTAGTFGTVGLASARRGRRSHTGDSDTVSSGEPETTLVYEGETFNAYKTEYEGEVSIGRVYTSGEKEGTIEHEVVGAASEVSLVEEGGAIGSSSNRVVSAQSAGLPTVVEKFEEFENWLGDCNVNRCDGEHYLDGATVELTKFGDALGKGSLTRIISQIITYSRSAWAKTAAGWASVIAGALLALTDSDTYTIALYDLDAYGGYWPKAVIGGSHQYKANTKSDLTQIRGPTAHFAHLCEDPENRQ